MKNRDNHNILIVVFEDGSKATYSFPFSTQKQDAVEKVFAYDEFNRESVRKIIWINDTDQHLTMFSDFFDLENNEMDLIAHTVAEKNKQIRVSRNVIMQKLDIEMIKLLEREDACDDCRRHFSKFKRYLRDLPSLISSYPFKNPKEVINFNPYDNVFDLYIDNPGSGYTSPPTIEVEAPNGHPLKKGFKVEAEAVVEGGLITAINITQIGSSYISKPKVTVSTPDEEGGEQAVVVSALPENNADLPPLTIE
jgi:hypothetical protein